jgi:hypothetical protein
MLPSCRWLCCCLLLLSFLHGWLVRMLCRLQVTAVDRAGNSMTVVSDGAVYSPQPMDVVHFGQAGLRETGQLYWPHDTNTLSVTFRDVHPNVTEFTMQIYSCPLTVNVTEREAIPRICAPLVPSQLYSVSLAAVNVHLPWRPEGASNFVAEVKAAVRCSPWYACA